MTPSTNDTNASLNSGSTQLIAQSQALMMQLLDLQKWQQQVALRFVDAHQQLIQQCANGSGIPALMPMVPAVAAPQIVMPQPAPMVAEPMPEPVVAAAPAPMPAAAPAPVVHTPAPVAVAAAPKTAAPVAISAAPKAVAISAPKPAAPVARVAVPAAKPVHVNGHETGRNGTPAVAPAPVAKVAAPAPAAAPAGNLPPSVEEFKEDLLQAVSERTGYPVEMLDLSLPMESGLGIDSIKTVEVFSNLKRYHRAFQDADQDEEEALKEFTNFKTLGDIIGAYELRYQAAASGGGGQPAAATEGGVQRYTLQAVDAPSAGQKKTTHTAS